MYTYIHADRPTVRLVYTYDRCYTVLSHCAHVGVDVCMGMRLCLLCPFIDSTKHHVFIPIYAFQLHLTSNFSSFYYIVHIVSSKHLLHAIQFKCITIKKADNINIKRTFCACVAIHCLWKLKSHWFIRRNTWFFKVNMIIFFLLLCASFQLFYHWMYPKRPKFNWLIFIEHRNFISNETIWIIDWSGCTSRIAIQLNID